jgi:hypothetical protein
VERGLAVLEPLGCFCQPLGLAAAAFEVDLRARFVCLQELLDGPGVRPAEDRIWVSEVVQLGVAGRVPGDSHARAEDLQPGVAFLGDGRPEPPALGEEETMVCAEFR